MDVYGIDEAAALMKIDRRVVRKLIEDGQLESKRAGRKFLIPEESLKKYLGVRGSLSLGYMLKAVEKGTHQQRIGVAAITLLEQIQNTLEDLRLEVGRVTGAVEELAKKMELKT